MTIKPENQKTVLVAPGGGLRGVIQSGVLAAAEEQFGRPLHEIVDLAVSSSVGAVTSLALGLGVPMRKVQHTIGDKPCTYFTQNRLKQLLNLLRFDGLYDYRQVTKALASFGGDVRFGDVKTPIVVAAGCNNDNKVHFFKSDDPKDASRRLLDVASYAYAAPGYFGARNSPAEGRTYVDAGVGTMNNPLRFAFWEVEHRGWLKTHNVNIVVVGTGYDDSLTPYSVTGKEGLCAQLKRSIRFASTESDLTANAWGNFLDEVMEKVTLTVIDKRMAPGSSAMDRVGDVDLYFKAAEELAAGADFKAAFGLV